MGLCSLEGIGGIIVEVKYYEIKICSKQMIAQEFVMNTVRGLEAVPLSLVGVLFLVCL
jgi:hypothetical protein